MTDQEINYIKHLIQTRATEYEGRFMLWWLSPRELNPLYGEAVTGSQKRYRVNKVLNIMAAKKLAKKDYHRKGSGWVWEIQPTKGA